MTGFTTDDLQSLLFDRYDPNRISLSPRRYFDRYRRASFEEDSDVAELFHENTKYVGDGRIDDERRRAQFWTPEMQYAVANVGPDPSGPVLDLPEPEPLASDLSTVLADRRSTKAFTGAGISAQRLGSLLGHAAGVTDTRSVAVGSDQVEKTFRAYPSAGGLYPVELYLCVVHSPDIDSGIYRYVPDRHGMERIREGHPDFQETVYEASFVSRVPRSDVEGSAMVVVMTAAFWRSKAKYGPRGYRYVLQESGHLAQNLQVVGSALQLGSCPLGGFDDRSVGSFLGVDGVDEAPIYSLVVGDVGGVEA